VEEEEESIFPKRSETTDLLSGRILSIPITLSRLLDFKIIVDK
jgi:hypothetical protein